MKDAINNIKQLNIVDGILKYNLKLTKKGTNYSGLCPFHNEKTPSFSVFPGSGTYKCFGCGASGDLINFVIEHKKLDFVEAVKEICNNHNIIFENKKLSKEELEKVKEQKDLVQEIFNINSTATNFFETNLRNDVKASEYAFSRIDDLKILQQFRVGYAADKWQGVYNHLKKNNFDNETLKESKLIGYTKEKYYDKFRDRLMFPIQDVSGKIVGFGGRDMSGKEDSAKYLNSANSHVYRKEKILYGIYFAKNHLGKNKNQFDYINIVEGYTDVLRMHQHGSPNTVAPCGTSLTLEQIKLIKRFTKNVNLVFDGDDAGRSAIIRSQKLLIEEGLNVYVTLLPQLNLPEANHDLRKLIKPLQILIMDTQ